MRGLAFLLALVLSGVAVACGGDDQAAPEPETVTVTTPQPPAQTGEETAPAGDDATETDDADDDAAQGGGNGQVFQVRNAGTVTLRADGGRLRIGSVDPASGWNHRVTEEERDEVEIEFTRGGTKLEFEAEIDDGRIETKVEDE